MANDDTQQLDPTPANYSLQPVDHNPFAPQEDEAQAWADRPQMQSDEDVALQQINADAAPRQGGLLQSIPELYNAATSSEGREKLGSNIASGLRAIQPYVSPGTFIGHAIGSGEAFTPEGREKLGQQFMKAPDTLIGQPVEQLKQIADAYVPGAPVSPEEADFGASTALQMVAGGPGGIEKDAAGMGMRGRLKQPEIKPEEKPTEGARVSLPVPPPEVALPEIVVKPEGATTAKAMDGLQAFKDSTGRDHGTAPTDLNLLGRGDVSFPPGKSLDTFANDVTEKIQDVKDWNNPQRRFWYETGGNAILTAVGGDPEMADRVTATVAKTSQGTPVLDNASYAARGHSQAMVGDPISTGRFPNVMGEHIQGYYTTPETGVIGNKISGYQSGFRSSWTPILNAGANDIRNMRWLGFTNEDGSPFSGTPTTSQHNYDRLLRSAVTHHLNAENYDGGGWTPGQVQAVGWAKARAMGGVPEEQAGYDIANAFNDRTARLTYETAPGKTSNHLPEYHDAPFAAKQEFHDALNGLLTDPMGRDIIASHMGLLTTPSEHGFGVYQNAVSPGSAAKVITGGAGGWQAGMDPATRELVRASELARGLLLRQDAVAAHQPVYPKNLTASKANTIDIRTGAPMTLAEAQKVSQLVAQETGTDFFSPVFTSNGYRFLNVPEASGLSNKTFHTAIDKAIQKAYPDTQTVESVKGHSDIIYEPNDWSKNRGADYLKAVKSLRPDVQRRVAEVLATLGPDVSRVEDTIAAKHGWTPDPSTRLWETNPAYQKYRDEIAKITPGVPPKPWASEPRPLRLDLLNNPLPRKIEAPGAPAVPFKAAARNQTLGSGQTSDSDVAKAVAAAHAFEPVEHNPFQLPEGFTLRDNNQYIRDQDSTPPAGYPESWSYRGPGISSGSFSSKEAAIADAHKYASTLTKEGAPPDAYPNPQTQTTQFKNWFGKSKVVDQDGSPLRAYHGTTKDFESFNTNPDEPKARANPSWFGELGSWFAAPSKHTGNYDLGNAEALADTFTKSNRHFGIYQTGARTIPAYLKIEKPMEYDDHDELYSAVYEAGGPRQLRTKLEKAGYDGAVVRNSMTDGHIDRDDWIAFHPEQIKSATGNSGAFNPKNKSILGSGQTSDEVAPRFFSAVEAAVNNAKTTSAPASQWLGMLKNTPGVKPEEMEWIGLNDWLKDQKGNVTKQQIADYVKDNKVDVQEVEHNARGLPTDIDQWKQGTPRTDEESGHEITPLVPPGYSPGTGIDISHNPETGEVTGYTGFVNGEMVSDKQHDTFESAVKDLSDALGQKTTGTRHSKWVLPGGENYRELLLTLPPPKAKILPKEIENLARTLYETYDRLGGDPPWERIAPDVQQLYRSRAEQKSYLADNPQLYHSSHWDEPNVLAHVRFDDRNIEGDKTLHMSEIQSDWAQKIRKVATTQAKAEGLKKDTPEFYKRVSELTDDPAFLKKSGVPDRPWKRSEEWGGQAIKRMIRYASEHGYDRISWDTGATNADRYDLSKHISKIDYERSDDGRYEVHAFDHVGNRVIEEDEIPIERVEELLGKELTKKIEDGVGIDSGGAYRSWKSIEGLDLKVGGEGMHGFYDKILPAAANKLVKKYGAKVESAKLGAPDTSNFREYVYRREGEYPDSMNADMLTGLRKRYQEDVASGNWPAAKEPDQVPVHSIKLTPELKKAALSQGFPLFAAGGAVRGEQQAFSSTANTNQTGAGSGSAFANGGAADDDTASGENDISITGPAQLTSQMDPNGFDYSDWRRSSNIEDVRNKPEWQKAIETITRVPLEQTEAKFGYARGGAVHYCIDASHDVVSGANSTPTKVEVDRHIPEFSPKLKDKHGKPANLRKYLAVHEEEEAKGQKQGMSYAKAHSKCGTPSERKAVEADGINWKAYTEEMAGYLSHIEHEKVRKPPPVGEHVDPKKAIARAAGGRVIASNINHRPSEGQKSAGNYAMEHVSIQGLPITIENARGSKRRGIGRDGKSWTSTLPTHYGYFKRTEGRDGDHVDVYLGPHTLSKRVWVIDQLDHETKKFDEHKVMLGFGAKQQAINTYKKAFSDDKGDDRIGHVTEMSINELKAWLASGKTKQPMAYSPNKQRGKVYA